MNSPIHSESQLLASAFALVSRCWLKEADMDLVKRLNDPATKTEFENLGGFVPAANVETVENLALDYCQLLVGPKNHVLPIQSVWESDRLESESSSSMRMFFAILKGYEPPISIVDHLGVQLDFASRLLAMDSEVSQEIFAKFHYQHLNWALPLLTVVHQKTQSDFFLGLGTVTKNLLQLAIQDVE